MHNEMPSLRSLAKRSSHLSHIKGYLSPGENRPESPGGSAEEQDASSRSSWRQWAGKKLRRSKYDENGAVGSEIITLFPGWATRRYRPGPSGKVQDAFDIEVFVSGFAVIKRPPELASRSQRAFMRLARGYASLPKIGQEMRTHSPSQTPPVPSIPLSPSTEELLRSIKLPPRPTEISDDFDMALLEQQFQNAKDSSDSSSLGANEDSDADSASGSSRSSSVNLDFDQINLNNSLTLPELRRLHLNLESRLQPFWASALSSRIIQIRLFPTPAGAATDPEPANPPHFQKPHLHHHHHHHDTPAKHSDGALYDTTVSTASDGSFEARFVIPWEDLCAHSVALHIAFGESTAEAEIQVVAELTPPIRPPPSPRSGHQLLNAVTETIADAISPTAATALNVPLTYAPLRVVSDIDDTVKASHILSGARAVFYNVFVKDLKDSVIPGVGEWYTGMWKRGVRFHYVSNGPFELLPVVNDFLKVSNLPPGSVRLRSYVARSLFNGFLSAPSNRKRPVILDLLSSFPTSTFIFIGDTGEQDLEVYAAVAKERPSQVAGVFLREAGVGGGGGMRPIDDPTGWKSVEDLGVGTTETVKGKRFRKNTSPVLSSIERTGYFSSPLTAEPEVVSDVNLDLNNASSGRSTTSSTSSTGSRELASTPLPYTPMASPPGSPNLGTATVRPRQKRQNTLTEPERRRKELQARVHRARLMIPNHIPLRVFRHPGDCVEVEGILQRYCGGVGSSLA